MKKFKRIKPRTAILISLVLTLLICISSFVLMNVSVKISENSEHLSQSMEEQWRSYTKSLLQDLEKKILTAVDNNEVDPYDEKALNEWVVSNLPFMNTDGMINNFAIVNLGYRIRDQALDLQLNFLEGKLDEGSKNAILSSYNSLLQNIHDKNIEYIVSRINEESVQLSKQFTYINSDVFKKMFMDAILLDDNIVGTSNVKLNQIEEIYKDDSCWTESIVIPNGILGFNEEPPYINNQKNPMYKKIAIYVSVDKNVIMENYMSYHNNTKQLVDLSIYLLILMSVFCIFVIAILFVSVIKANGGVCDADDNHKDSNSDDADRIYVDGTGTK